ncbi:ABC transporter permease [Variovorax sp. AFSI2.2]|uniref:ABC transporter permease n=1 Tax=Variovorax sp. AFSI2.2 TaxID=3384160 RepID=UPI003EB8DA7D
MTRSAAAADRDTPVRPRRFTADDRVWVSLGLYAALAVTVGLPLVLMFLWSTAQRWSPPGLLPGRYTLAHWTRILGDDSMIEAVVSSVLIALTVTALTAVVSVPTAWALAKFPMRAKRLIEIFILAPLIVPGVVVAVGLGEVFLRLGLMYTFAGVVLVQMVGTLPLMIRLLVAAFETMPDELLHAARCLGASPWRAFVHVVLPLSVPALLAGGLLSFVASFEEFDKSFVVGAPAVQTLPILLYQYLDPYSLQFPLASVVAIVLLIPALVIFLVAGRIMRDDVLAAGMGKV